MIERLKESIQRVVAWAKRNPRKAALAAAGLLGGLFLMWWLSRRERLSISEGEIGKPGEEPVPGIPELPPVPEIPPPPPPPALPDIPVEELPPLDLQIPIPFFEPPPLEPVEIPGLPALEVRVTEPVSTDPVSRVSWVTAGYPEPRRTELQVAYELYRRGEWESYPASAARTFTIRPEIRVAYEAQRAGERSAMEITRAYMARAREVWSGTRPEVRAAYEAQRAGERMAIRSTPSPSAAALGLSVQEAIAEHRAMRQTKRPESPPPKPQPARRPRRSGVPE